MFEYIKNTVLNNAINNANPEIQYHLATNASKWCLEGILFQLVDISPETEATHSYKENIYIIMFIFFWLENAETWYNTMEKEVLAVIQCLAKV